MATKYRLSIDLNPSARIELPKLQKKCGCTNLVDMVRKAFAVLEMVTDHVKAGGKVILQDKNGEQEVVKIL